MISFSLCCDKGHEFDGWFRNSAVFDEQAGARELACPVCGSSKIEKTLMAPNIPVKANKKDDGKDSANAGTDESAGDNANAGARASVFGGAASADTQKLVEQIRGLRKHLRDEADYVGDKFAEEARKIHYEETEKRGIYGEASLDEARELLEEGVGVLPIPSLPEDHN